MRDFLSAWQFDPFIAANLAALAALYLWGVRRAKARAPRTGWPTGATVSFMSAVVLLALVLLGPMAAWSHTFFWVHMTQHLVIMMAAAPLMVLGLPVTLWYRASSDSVRRRVVVPFLRSRFTRVVTNPYVTWLFFAGVLMLTHFTPFFDWALRNHDADIFIEQPLFLIAAFMYYLPMLGRNMLPGRSRHALRFASMSAMMLPEAIVGAVIYFSPVVLYSVFAESNRPYGPAPLPDQQLAGALMWALVMVIEAGWMMLIAVEWFAGEERKGRILDRQREADIVAS